MKGSEQVHRDIEPSFAVFVLSASVSGVKLGGIRSTEHTSTSCWKTKPTVT